MTLKGKVVLYAKKLQFGHGFEAVETRGTRGRR